MVRLNGDERPMDRQDEFSAERSMKIAGLLCRDPMFWEYLHEDNQILNPTEDDATDWLREYLGLKSRAELKTNREARMRLDSLNVEFVAWKQKN
jgi:hypothetical protein